MLFFLSFVLASALLLNASADADAAVATSSQVEAEIIKKLNPILSPNHYVVLVKVTHAKVQSEQNQVPLLPKNSLKPTTVRGLDFSDIERVDVVVMLASHYGGNMQSQVRRIIETTLADLPSAKLQMTFETLEVTPAPLSEEAKAMIEASQNRQPLAPVDNRGVSNDRLEEKMNTFADRLTALPQSIADKIDGVLQGTKQEQPVEKDHSFLFLTIAGAVALALLAVGFFGFLGLGKISSSLETGLKMIGANGSSGSGGGDVERVSSAPQAEIQPENASKDVQHLQHLEVYLKRLREQILSSLNKENQDVVLDFIISNASSDATTPTAGLALELIGEVHVKNLISRIPAKQKRKLKNFFNFQSFSSSEKVQAMTVAGEKLLSSLTATFVVDEGVVHDATVKLRVLGCETFELVRVSESMSREGLSRLMGYLKPETISGVIQAVEKKDPEKAKQLTEACAGIPFFLTRADLDSEIIQGLDQIDAAHQEVAKVREHKSFYLRFLEVAADTTKSRMIENLRAIDPDFAQELDASVVTFMTFWRLPNAIQLSILDKISIDMIAVLIVDASEERHANILKASLSGPQQEILEDELRVLGDTLPWNKIQLLNAAKDKIREEIESIAGAHDLTTLFEQEGIEGNADSINEMARKMAS